MPELPEVETVLRELRAALEGQTLRRVIVRRDSLRWPIPKGFASRTERRKVVSLRRRGKYILIRLDSDDSILLHLGMSGRIRIMRAEGVDFVRHEHVVLETDGGLHIGFVDPRRFGALDLMPTTDEDMHPLLAKIGLEPLGPDFTTTRLAALLRGRKGPIKTVLLDQRLIAGLGNIYVCEALFRAGIHPEIRACDVAADAVVRLAAVIPVILENAIAAGGSSLRDYARTDGKSGGFQDLHQVYGREHEACPDCPGQPLCAGIRRIVQAGRSTFYCPQRQHPAS
ncbi:bifunctional DNA-formamidopyrimidine glycosylase/DNA-(apurinic or apyrimidinic site) lyase [Neoasaia chiangmaiensis]|uniref:Formamidopyrimidine-DNA glycosylase n=1 Tax=Neoasaia chiangmaiensis TaxID=320497 RepID=A0A1U9KMP6_9PROT|nr:bifunctional DNA-formamidopyrimidine glycosylase/DNA-(apurinic or apyrimidinic site) lyase [Neoasaia chiangmaiensis]AQS87059.1 DNA-formamidopyrimidine glycosylase [Neoasaia chiangmaiensis]